MNDEEQTIKIFVINLAHSVDRRSTLIKKLSQYGVNVEFFDAVNGSQIPEHTMQEIHDCSDIHRKFWGEGTKMSRGEAGVALSHLQIYKKIAEDNIPFAIILEDDADFDSRLQHIVNKPEFMSKIMDAFDLVLMGYCRNDLDYRKPAECSFWGSLKFDSILQIGVPIHWYWSAIGYVISKKGAEKLLSKNGIPKIQADFLTANSPAYGLRLGIFKQPIVWEGQHSKNTTINDRGLVHNGPHTGDHNDAGSKSGEKNVQTKFLKKISFWCRHLYLRLVNPITVLNKKATFKRFTFKIDVSKSDM